MAEFAHNSWKHDVSNKSPHELLHGINPTIRIETNDTGVLMSTERLRDLEQARRDAQKRLEKVQARAGTRPQTTLKPNDQVWLDGRNLSIAGTKKLMPKRYGPFKILAQVSPVAYRLELPATMKIHDVFHIDLLTPYRETAAYGTPYTRPPPIIDNSEEEYEVESITDMRRHGRKRKLQYRVHWKGYPTSEDSWVDHKDLHAPDALADYIQNSAPAGQPNV
jgi:hypothetical protein